MSDLPHVSLRHVGIYVTDFETMVDFYVGLFGFHVSDIERAPDRQLAFLTNDPDAHHTFVIAGGRLSTAPSTINQLSFQVETLADVRRYWYALEQEPRVRRKYAITHGNAWSVYFWDPEGNRVEVYCDTPWHIPQPAAHDIDLRQSDAEIYRQTEAIVRADPKFESFAEFTRKTAEVLKR